MSNSGIAAALTSRLQLAWRLGEPCATGATNRICSAEPIGQGRQGLARGGVGHVARKGRCGPRARTRRNQDA